MTPIVILDSTPLALIIQRRDYKEAEACRDWLRRIFVTSRVLIPEIVNYELRRELLRLNKSRSLAELAALITPDRDLPLTRAALELAAQLWADTRRHGKPTADPHALDIDAILSAQVLTAGFTPGDFVVATSNVSHIGLFVPAAPWQAI